MTETYQIKDDNLIITVPIHGERNNCYEPEVEGAKFMRIVGYVNKRMSEYGFGFWIDMSYKGKDDQDTGLLFHWLGGQTEFEKFCSENAICIIVND